MSLSPEKLKTFDMTKKLDPKIWKLLEFINGQGFELILVGGGVRDLLFHGHISRDLDFELRPIPAVVDNDRDVSLLIDKLKAKLRTLRFTVKDLKFSVFRVRYRDFELEFSLPRLEIFNEESVLGHSDFKAQYDGNLPYNMAWARRDFTINAIGIDLFNSKHGLRFIDPLRGLDDFTKSLLRPCSEEFYRDPVRFLRCVRFSINLKFSFHPTLEKQLKKMNLKKLSPYYFFYEAFKSICFFSFMRSVYDYTKTYGIEIPLFMEKLAFLKEKKYRGSFSHVRELVIKLAFDGELRDEDIFYLENYLSLKKNTYKNYVEYFDFIQRLDDIKKDTEKTVRNFDYKNSVLIDLYKFKEKIKKRNTREKKILLSYKKWPSWLEHFVFENEKGRFEDIYLDVPAQYRRSLFTLCQLEKVFL